MTIRWDADYDPKKEKYTYTQTQKINDLLEDNLEQQINGVKGWTEDRTMRKVGSIPPGAFYNWYIKNNIAHLPWEDRQAEFMKFLLAHPEFRVVDKMKHDTAHQTHIIVKS